jgi:uncharacterized protein
MGGFFISVYRFFSKRRFLFFATLLLILALIAWLAMKLRLSEDISKVLPNSEKVSQYLKVVNHSAFADELVIFVGGNDTATVIPPTDLIAFADELADSIRSALVPGQVGKLRVRADDDAFQGVYNDFRDHLPIFLNDDDYIRLDSVISDESISRAVGAAYRNLVSPVGFATREWLLKDPLGIAAIGLKKLGPLSLDESYVTRDGYIFSRDMKYLVLFLTPAQKATETSANGAMLDRLDRIISSAGQHFDGRIRAGYFGSVAVSVANARQLKRDIWLTMSMAVLLLVLFIGFYFRNFKVIPAIVLTTLMSAGISVAILSLMNRDISAVSLGFGAVLLGIAIAYTIHYLNHLKDIGDPKKVLRDISLPIVMSSIISAGDFFTLLLVRSETVRDLGLFAGFSILAAGLLTLIFLPHLTRNIRWERPAGNFVSRSVYSIASYPVGKLKWMPVFIIAGTVVFYITSRQVTFESDMTGMSHMTRELKEAESTLDRISQYSLRSVFVITRGDNLDKALAETDRLLVKAGELKEQGLVKKYASVTDLAIPMEEQQRRIARWNAFWTPEKKEQVKAALAHAEGEYGFKAGSFSGFTNWLNKDFTPVSRQEMPHLNSIFLDPYISEDGQMATVTTILKVRQEDKPAIYQALGTEKESFIFDRQFLTSAFMDILNDDFNKLVLVSMLIVFLVLLVSYGRIELAIITFIPMLISWVWTLGIMGIFGIKLNIFNIIITSFVFGLGIDYALFSVQGMLQLYKTGHDETVAYRSSVLMDATTTLIGLGVLIFAVHPALRSMALSAVIGICCVWFVTWAIGPGLFRWLVYLENGKRPVPVTAKDFFFAILSLTIFVVGTLILLIYGFLVFKIFRVKKGKLKEWFHDLLMHSSRFLIYANFLSPKKIVNRDVKDLKRPAVLIANHQSHIDIALVLMLHPRLLELTNDRVQHSFGYGPLMKMAEFYPVSDGMDVLVEKLRGRVEEGYSILVFPEGTRSPDERIQRFHKGAFYLAEKLNLDILPVLIHGSGPVMTKGEYFLKKGSGTIKFLPRIRPDDPAFGSDLLERSRAFRRYMASEYQKIVDMDETPRYFRERLIKNYVYKGPVLEWYIRIKIRMEKDYQIFHEHLPKDGHITDVGCGYGFMDYMLMFLSRGRTITGFDYDEEKINVANHCPGKNNRINFIAADVIKADLPESDAFVISDVLHYMPEEEQENLIRTCIGRLRPGGVLMIRDADRELTGEHRRTRLSEFFSTRIGFNRTNNDDRKLYFTSGHRIQHILEEGGLAVTGLKEDRKTSNIIFIARKIKVTST